MPLSYLQGYNKRDNLNETNNNEMREEEDIWSALETKERRERRESARTVAPAATKEYKEEPLPEVLEYVKPRQQGLRGLLPEEKTAAERTKEAYRGTEEVIRKYAPRVKRAAVKALGAVQTYSERRRRRLPQEARKPSITELVQGFGRKRAKEGSQLLTKGGIGTQGLKGGISTKGTSPLGDQVRSFGQTLKKHKRA